MSMTYKLLGLVILHIDVFGFIWVFYVKAMAKILVKILVKMLANTWKGTWYRSWRWRCFAIYFFPSNFSFLNLYWPLGEELEVLECTFGFGMPEPLWGGQILRSFQCNKTLFWTYRFSTNFGKCTWTMQLSFRSLKSSCAVVAFFACSCSTWMCITKANTTVAVTSCITHWNMYGSSPETE